MLWFHRRRDNTAAEIAVNMNLLGSKPPFSGVRVFASAYEIMQYFPMAGLIRQTKLLYA